MGQWLDCYAQKNNLKISVIASQCGDRTTNGRPNSTATIIGKSLKYQKSNYDFCVMTVHKQNKNSLSYALSDPRFAGSLVVIVWDHGAIPYLLTVLGAKNDVQKPESACYDLAYDLDTSTGQTFIHKMATLEPPDACSTACADGKHLTECNAYTLPSQI